MVEVDFKEIKKLDEVLKEVVEEKVKERGYFFILSDKDDSTTLVISAGEKPTEGYEVKVTNAIQEGDILTVIVEEIEPSDDEIVADKISYPYTVVKLENTDAKEFYVIDVEGKEFFNIEKETKEVKAKGIFNGTIGNDSIEILLDGEKEPRIFNTEELKNLEIPKENTKVKIFYYINEDGENILTFFEIVK